MIYTYYIIGYVYEYPFINKKLSRKIMLGEIDSNSIPEKVKLILINVETNELVLKLYGYLKNNEIYHSYDKKSNYFKFIRAIFGIRDVVKGYALDLSPKMFASKVLSYNTCTNKWVKTPSCKIINLKITNAQNIYTLIRDVHIRKIFLYDKIYNLLDLKYEEV